MTALATGKSYFDGNRAEMGTEVLMSRWLVAPKCFTNIWSCEVGMGG